ncbi:hypothetical protein CEXT_755431 [Caerostris extrusa]|uniref:Uncharacterized protein n=1 Tax=Caerostris extrusa TaxID=172846 RepID=A0AAV4MVX6_CAEEX|nr:hypothetical protein CEXT_755431 [Caerostris extrusa]
MGIYSNECNRSTKHYGTLACPTRTAPDLWNLLNLLWSCRPHKSSYLALSVAFPLFRLSSLSDSSVHSLPCGMLLLFSHLVTLWP